MRICTRRRGSVWTAQVHLWNAAVVAAAVTSEEIFPAEGMDFRRMGTEGETAGIGMQALEEWAGLEGGAMAGRMAVVEEMTGAVSTLEVMAGELISGRAGMAGRGGRGRAGSSSMRSLPCPHPGAEGGAEVGTHTGESRAGAEVGEARQGAGTEVQGEGAQGSGSAAQEARVPYPLRHSGSGMEVHVGAGTISRGGGGDASRTGTCEEEGAFPRRDRGKGRDGSTDGAATTLWMAVAWGLDQARRGGWSGGGALLRECRLLQVLQEGEALEEGEEEGEEGAGGGGEEAEEGGGAETGGGMALVAGGVGGVGGAGGSWWAGRMVRSS